MPAPARPFVTGRWSDLLLLTYEAPEDLLRPYLHPALELDRWEGRTHVNLVALHFGAIRVRGRRFPGLGAFAQLNLRTFVRHGGEPGVVFIRQFVPSPLVVAVSRFRYRQPYAALPLSYQAAAGDGRITAEYFFDRPPRGCLIATGSEGATVPPSGSFPHYCKERFWGFARGRGGRLLRFRVEHPAWAVRQVLHWQLQLDFRAFFGPEWRFLNGAQPAGVVFAVGSEVAVYAPSDV
ncbi:MAG TPA: DUF2071 domain-containing protein [Gemmatimonadales bacterium]|nr:DUF2071 domain-containing protein [Gemmatimonadales bacterium]